MTILDKFISNTLVILLDMPNKIKIHISLSKDILDKIDELKKFPKWNNKRSKAIEGILEQYFYKNG